MKTAMRRVQLLGVGVLLGALVFVQGCYLFSQSKTYYGLKTSQFQRVAFVIDTSGSMVSKQEASIGDKVKNEAVRRASGKLGSMIGGRLGGIVSRQVHQESTKLGGAKRALIPAIRGLSSKSSFALISFSSKASLWQARSVSASDLQKGAAITYVKSLKAGGSTSALAALRQALLIPGIQAVFFLSDGRPTDANATKILGEVGRLNAKQSITIHTVGLGKDQDARFLSALAEQNKGKYVAQ